jgi:outer membrane protein assembly factor BamD
MINSSFRGSSASRALRVLCLLTLATVATGCSSKAKRDTPDNPFRPGTDVGSGGVPQSESALKAQARSAYVKAHLALLNTDYEVAIEQYSQLIARYPFTEFATQAELEKVYAQYRSFKPDEALLAADRFLREHPRHKHADYIQYLKGLVNAARTESISDYLPIDSSKKDVNAERRAYDDFAVLVQRYPQSVYAGDARKRMVHLRNRIASHELSIIRFYVKRQAWVAVSKRAENLIAEYPGAPATAEALNLLKLGYEKLDLKPQLADLERIIAANSDTFRLADAPPVEPGPRSRIGLPDAAGNSPVSTLKAPVAAGPTLKATAAAPTATPTATDANKDAPKGFFARLGSYLNVLNKSYTLDSEQVKDSPAPPQAGGEQPNAPVAAASEAPPVARPSTRNPEQRNSLTTGPYFEDTQVDVRPVTGSAPAAAPAPAAEAATAGAPAADKPAEAPKKTRGFFGWLDGLSGSYTVGEDGKVVETPAVEPATPPAAADKPAETAPAN